MLTQGDMYELTASKSSLKKAPKDYHSVKGCGKTIPDPKGEQPLSDEGEDAQVLVRTPQWELSPFSFFSGANRERGCLQCGQV